jgi:parallel beta-helix repeat protein
VTTSPGCPWVASEAESWIAITSGTPGVGSGTLNFTFDANGGVERQGTITIAGLEVLVTQAAGSPPDECEDGTAEGYVADTGGNNGAAGTKAAPWKTISFGVTQTTSGETLCIREGDYTGVNNTIDNNVTTVNSGTTWNNAPIIRAYPGETITLKQPNGEHTIRLQGNVATAQYLIFQDLIFDGSTNTSEVEMIYMAGGVHHVRFQRNEFKDSWNMGMSAGPFNGESHHFEILDNYFHDLGLDPDPSCNCQLHAIYGTVSDSLVKGNIFWRNYGTPVNFYAGPEASELGYVRDNIISHNRVYNNHPLPGCIAFGACLESAGILISDGHNNKVFNNQVHDNDIGIQVYSNTSGTKVYNNTIYRNTNAGLFLQYYWDGPSDFKNNIVYLNGTNVFDTLEGTGEHTFTTNLIGVDPLFIASGFPANLRVSALSPAVNAGTDTSASGVTDDFDGVARPVGGTYDIGAFEQ